MKKFIALLLALVMVFALVACGSNETPSTPSDPSTPGSTTPDAPSTPDEPAGPATDSKGRYPAETVKIGFLNFDTTGELYLTVRSYYEYLQEFYNFEVIWSESLDSAEGEAAFIEQCAAAGCQAIVGYYNVANEEAVNLCTSLGMYYWGQGGNPAIVEKCSDNPLYLGSFYVGPADYNYGYGCIEALVDAGCHKVIVASGGKDFGVQMFIDRYQGAMDAIAHYQSEGYDIEMVYEVSGWPGTEEFSAKQTEALSDTVGADSLCSLLGAMMWVQPIQAANKFDQIKVAAVDTLSEGVLGMFGAGLYVGCSAEIADVFGMAIPMIINAVEGYGEQQREADGSAPMIDADWWLVTNVEDASYYASVQGLEGWAIDEEDIRSMLYAYNADLTLDHMRDLYTSVTAEEIQARR